MITSLPNSSSKDPNDDSKIDGGPKSAFRCVQPRCRSPPTTTMLNSGNNIDMTNSAILHSPSKVIKHSSDVLYAATSLDKHNMPFPQIYNIPLNNTLCTSTNHHQLSSDTGKLHELIKLGMNNNRAFKEGSNVEDVLSTTSNKRHEQIAQLTQLHNQLSCSTTDHNSRYTAAVKDYVKSQIQMLDSNAPIYKHDTIFDALNGSNQGIGSVLHGATQSIDPSIVSSSMMFQRFPQAHEEENVLGTRVPATTQSDKCHQRARAIIQHNQSPEKIRRYK